MSFPSHESSWLDPAVAVIWPDRVPPTMTRRRELISCGSFGLTAGDCLFLFPFLFIFLGRVVISGVLIVRDKILREYHMRLSISTAPKVKRAKRRRALTVSFQASGLQKGRFGCANSGIALVQYASPFLMLPGEIRALVYRALLGNHTGEFADVRYDVDQKPWVLNGITRVWVRLNFSGALLHACRQM